MQLNPQQLRALKKLAHHLKPVVMIGQKGLSENVINEIDIALDAHELIKLKLAGSDKEERSGMSEEISRRMDASLVQIIGQTAVFYRANPKKKKNRILV